MSKSKFLKTLYIAIAEEGTENEFLFPAPTFAEHAIVGEAVKIGEYKLVGVRTVYASPELSVGETK